MTVGPVRSNGEILFVYFGEKLPKYAYSALELAKRFSGLSPVLISNARMAFSRKLSGIHFVPIQEFYDPLPFQDSLEKFSRSTASRAGLWRYSLERFFVLGQYARFFEKRSFVHAELDQLLFRVDILSNTILTSEKRGLFLPFASRDSAVASIVLCNEIAALEHFLDFVKKSKKIESEMKLLAQWAPSSEGNLFALATPAHSARKIAHTPDGIEVLGSEMLKGAVDAAQVGQWLGGADPRNLPWRKKPTTKFVDSGAPNLLSPEDFANFRLDLDRGGNLHYFIGGTPGGNLYNLHLHSKTHSWILQKPGNLQFLLTSSNEEQEFVIPGTRTTQALHLLRRFSGTITRRMAKRAKKLFGAGTFNCG